MSLPETFLSPKKNDNRCLLCQQTFNVTDKPANLGQKGWTAFKENALLWSKINAITENTVDKFRFVYEIIKDTNEAYGKSHANCRLIFGSRALYYTSRYGEKQDEEAMQVDRENEQGEQESQEYARKSGRHSISSNVQRKCFICDEVREQEGNAYNEGGLGRCEMTTSSKRLIERSSKYIDITTHRFHDAAKRFSVLQSGQSFDCFSIDIYYHKSCYIKYAINDYDDILSEDINNTKAKHDDVMNGFYRMIRLRIVRNKVAILFHHLVAYLDSLYEEYDLDEGYSKSRLKEKLQIDFKDEIDFYPIGKYVIVHPSNINPCAYSVATLLGQGLKDMDHIKSFSNFLKRKIKETPIQADTLNTPDDIIDGLDNVLIRELYNTIYATMYDSSFKVNEHGYAKTASNNISTKIWAVASDWQSLITRKDTAKQAILGLTVHRLTGNKETIVNLNKFGHSVSYSTICQYNERWSKSITPVHTRFLKGIPLHSSIDNNDGRQETMTGSGTTHDTNATLFQPLLPGEAASKSNDNIFPKEGDCVLVDESDINVIPEYTISKAKRSDPPAFKSYNDDDNTDEVDLCFRRDVAWSLANGINSQEKDDDSGNTPLLGSWTAFNREVSERVQEKSHIEFMPVINQPPKYDVCKHYLDILNVIVEELGLEHMFVHADEDVYARLAHILWKHGDLYRKVIILIGGFHQLRVRQRLIYKRHGIMGYKQWMVDSGIIAAGSVDKAFGGQHYYRCMRILKESFDALVQFGVEQLTNNYHNIEETLKQSLRTLCSHPSTESLQNVLSSTHFSSIVRELVSVQGQQDGMTVAYLRDVSSLLALVSSVREGDIERHLGAEREMLRHLFAFDHQNYARYLSYQHVLLNDLKINNPAAFTDLKDRGTGANYSGDKFAAVHGDLVTEYFNRETKVTAGPFRMGYSTNISTTNKWVKTIPIHAKLRMALRDKLNVKTSSTHKELTEGGKKKHQAHVTALKDQLKSYQSNPFESGPAKQISTGKEIKEHVIQGLLNAPETGNKQYLTFVQERLVDKSKSIFAPITRNSIDTGEKKLKKSPKVISILKEDRQAFGLLVAKAVSPEEAFTFPVTSIPLSIAQPNGTLRQANKSNFRNRLIRDAPGCDKDIAPTKSRWLYDGMALFRSVKPEKTYREWLKKVIKIALPPSTVEAVQVEIVNDQYLSLSTKSSTRLTRGEGEISRRVHLEGVDQNMLQGAEWNDFFNNGENKEDLIRLASTYYRSDEGRSLLNIPLVINSKEQCWKISKESITDFPNCNHEEADYRLVLHAAMSDVPAVIVATDTDVLVLLLYGMSQGYQQCTWYMKIDHNTYIDVHMIFETITADVCRTLPQYHAITGSDSTSYKFNVGKVRVWEKVRKDVSCLNLIKDLGKSKVLSSRTLKQVEKFVQTVVYSGKKTETLVETRIRLYMAAKTKTSTTLPPDPDSMEQDIKRAHLQSFTWINCLLYTIPRLDATKYGWTINEGQLTPVWFTGYQMPPSLRSRRRPSPNCDADIESSANHEETNYPKQRRLRKSQRSPKVMPKTSGDDDSRASVSTDTSDSRALEKMYVAVLYTQDIPVTGSEEITNIR